MGDPIRGSKSVKLQSGMMEMSTQGIKHWSLVSIEDWDSGRWDEIWLKEKGN